VGGALANGGRSSKGGGSLGWHYGGGKASMVIIIKFSVGDVGRSCCRGLTL